MNKIVKIAAATALVAASASASAWWGGPFTSMTDEFFGDGVGNGDFNMSMNANTQAHGRGFSNNRYYGYRAPYGYGPYGYAPVAPVAPVAPMVAPVAQAPVAK